MRTMIFVDHMNFYKAAKTYYQNKHGKNLPTFDYQKLVEEIHTQLTTQFHFESHYIYRG